MPHAGRDVPVDGAEVVPLLVSPDLGELDALAPEHGAVLTGEKRVDQRACPELDPLDLPEHCGGHGPPADAARGRHGAQTIFALGRHGTPTASRILAITWWSSISSAPASEASNPRGR